MTTAQQLQDFNAFANQQLASSDEQPSLDELFSRWRAESAILSDEDAVVAAVSEGYADVQAGNHRPFDESDKAFREQHGIPKDA